jgi:glycerol kinase
MNTETTAMGAAYLAGLAVGFWESIEEIKKIWTIDFEFKPFLDKKEVEQKINSWNKAVKRTLGWRD